MTADAVDYEATATNTTLLVLCGGQGTRMGGVDKPLVHWKGKALIDHVLDLNSENLPVIISANRNVDEYGKRGLVVIDDAVKLAGAEGPLVGVLAGLEACHTDWLLVTPGTPPHYPMTGKRR